MQRRTDLIDQDTIGKHPLAHQPHKEGNRQTDHETMQTGADIRGGLVAKEEISNQAPEGLRRKRMGPLNPSAGRRHPAQTKV